MTVRKIMMKPYLDAAMTLLCGAALWMACRWVPRHLETYEAEVREAERHHRAVERIMEIRTEARMNP